MHTKHTTAATDVLALGAANGTDTHGSEWPLARAELDHQWGATPSNPNHQLLLHEQKGVTGQGGIQKIVTASFIHLLN